MKFRLDVERRRLRGALSAKLAELNEPLRDAAASLPLRAGQGRRDTRWGECLTDLTVMYPLLIAEAFGDAAIEVGRRYLVPHSLLLMFSYLDDRARDGQIVQEAADLALSNWLLREARLGLESAGRRHRWDPSLMDELMTTYERAQAAGAAGPAALERLVVGRHLPGLICSAYVVQRCGADGSIREQVNVGFRHLVLSLQWVDDFRDIQEDLVTGADNLLLARIPNEVRQNASPSSAIAWLHAHGGFALAFDAAHRHVERARAAAGVIGCHRLANLIDSRLEGLDEQRKQARTMSFSSLAHTIR